MSFGYQILGFGSGGSPPPTITDISGKILVGTASNLTLTGTNFGTANLVVKFVQASDSISETVSVTPTSLTNYGAVAVPAAVYNNVTADNSYRSFTNGIPIFQAIQVKPNPPRKQITPANCCPNLCSFCISLYVNLFLISLLPFHY